MNILIIPAFIYTQNEPTLGSFIFEQAEALAERGHKVYILYCDTYSFKYAKQFLQYKEKNEVRQRVYVYRKAAFCPLKHGSGFYGVRKIFAKNILELFEEHLSGVSIDVIHAHCCVWAGYAAMKLSQRYHIPYVITEHSTMFGMGQKHIKGRYYRCIKQAFNSASRVLCVSSALEKIISEYTENTEILGNIVDTTLFDLREQHKCKTSADNMPFTFLAVCYLKTEGQLYKKGIDILMQAFEKVAALFPACQLKIGGGGDAVKAVEELIKQFGLEKNVTLLGSLSRQEVAQQMQACDCFVLPSRYETFGVVYAEAMACGKPVIGTRTGGPDSFVNESNGILIKTGDEEQMKKAMMHMVENAHIYDPNKIRKQIVERFSKEAIERSLVQIYKKIIEQREKENEH